MTEAKDCSIKSTDEFRRLPDDAGRWKWVKEHQHLGIIVVCDNDVTLLVFPDDKIDIDARFDDFIGWADGVFSLLAAFGIKAEAI